MTERPTPNCLCGKPATHTAYLPSNVWAGLRQLTEPQRVCDYHAEKVRIKGYQVVKEVDWNG